MKTEEQRQQTNAAARRCYARRIGKDVPLQKRGTKLGHHTKIRHGTQTEYGRHGCRCEQCRLAAREHARRFRNPVLNRQAVKRNHQRNLTEMRKAKAKPCTDCGIRYPYYVMQFDHLRDKKYDLGSGKARSIGREAFKTEIAKCEVVCANCHMERTHVRRLSKKADAPQIINASHLFQVAA